MATAEERAPPSSGVPCRAQAQSGQPEVRRAAAAPREASRKETGRGAPATPCRLPEAPPPRHAAARCRRLGVAPSRRKARVQDAALTPGAVALSRKEAGAKHEATLPHDAPPACHAGWRVRTAAGVCISARGAARAALRWHAGLVPRGGHAHAVFALPHHAVSARAFRKCEAACGVLRRGAVACRCCGRG